MRGRHICLTRSCVLVIQWQFLSSIANRDAQLHFLINKMNKTAVTQPLKITKFRLACEFLVCNPTDKAAMLGVNTIQYNFFSKNLQWKKSFNQFPEERNAFVLDQHHDRPDVMCKPSIQPDLSSLLAAKRRDGRWL